MINAGAGSVTVDVQAGEDIECTYTNTRNDLGSITIGKISAGGIGKFAFQSLQFGSFNLTTTAVNQVATTKFENLQAGVFAIAEVVPDGWDLTNLQCASALGTSAIGINGAAAAVTLATNDAVSCTYVNFKLNDDAADDVTKLFIHRLTHGPDRARTIRRLNEQQRGMKDGGSLKDTEPLKFSGLKGGRVGDVKVATSLSRIRSSVAAAEAKKAAGLQGLGFSDAPLSGTVLNFDTRFDVWVEGHLSGYDETTGGFDRDGRFGILYVGADYAIHPFVLVGVLAQFDWTTEDVNSGPASLFGEVKGNGWMVGPYVGVKLIDGLYFDARVAWGRSDNELTLTDTIVGMRTGDFETDRWLASASLTGDWRQGNWRISPSATIAYGKESRERFFTSLGQFVPDADISIGRVTFGPEIGYSFTDDSGTVIEPHVRIEGIWNFTTDGDTTLTNGTVLGDEECRGKIEGGVNIRQPNGVLVRGAISYDGIGHDDFSSVTGSATISIPLN